MVWWVRGKAVSTLLSALQAAVVLAGCGDGGGAATPGFQVQRGRDLGNLFYWNPVTLAFTRLTAAPGGTLQDLWVWPDGEPQPLVALSAIDWSPPRAWYHLIAGDALMTGAHGERVYDLAGRAALDLTSVVAHPPQSLASLDFAALRRDGKGLVAFRALEATLVVGRGTDLTPIAPLRVHGADFLGPDVVIMGGWVNDDAATLPLDDLYRVSIATGAITRMEVPTFDELSSESNRLDGLYHCAGFSTAPCPRFRVVGCGDDDPPCAETGRAPCAILYTRIDPSLTSPGRRRPYAHDVATGQEMALPGADPDKFIISPDRHRVAWMTSDSGQFRDPAGEDDIHVHDFCAGTDGMCRMPRPSRLLWRGDGRVLTAPVDEHDLGLIDVDQLDGGSCGVLGRNTIFQNVGRYLYAPAGDRLAWTGLNYTIDPITETLWIGDADGNQPRMLAEGPFLSLAFAPDGQRIFISRVAGDQFSLGWVSTVEEPALEHVVAVAYGGAATRGNRRLLLIDRWNAQDSSGTLALLDLESGARQDLAQAVTDFAVDGSVDGAARLAYAVRGRFASGQDGLWQTTLPPP